MDLLLWRWSVGVQWTSLAMITAFFLVLERSHRLPELRPWVVAWAANLVALSVSVLYWNWYPTGAAFRGIAASYLGTKVAFAILLIVGAVQLRGLGAQAIPARLLLLPIALFAAGGLLVPTLEGLGLVAYSALSVIFALGGVLLLRAGGGFSWLAGAMLLRSALFLVTTFAFAMTTSPAPGASSQLLSFARSFLAAHSFLDTGAEWVLALASVLALSERVSNELRRSNRELLAAQDDVRQQLADWDPLTALPSRRALPEVLRHLPAEDALLLFFDLERPPETGGGPDSATDDGRRRFASSLRDCFRSGDALVRYAGDEFLVIAPSLDPREAEHRVKRLRSCLQADGDASEVRFSVGTAPLGAGAGLEAALQAADLAIDDAKAARLV
jgi:GGDEF domain-containing protein